MITDYDVLIAGFGKAGKTIAAKLAAAGRKVALIEKDPGMYGGTCINVGCIPSKRLIEDAMHAPDGLLEEKAETLGLKLEEQFSDDGWAMLLFCDGNKQLTNL